MWHGFQSTRPHGARLDLYHGDCIEVMFQSTRPHGARPGGLYIGGLPERVSIHAPARGATFPGRPDRALHVPVSIHAPARGATLQIN